MYIVDTDKLEMVLEQVSKKLSYLNRPSTAWGSSPPIQKCREMI